MIELLDITYIDLPCVYIVDPSNLPNFKKFKLVQEIKKENIANFIQSWLHGKLKPTIKSDPIPPQSNANVKEIVGYNLEDVVLTEAYNVVLYIYSSQCQYCIDFEPKYTDLANTYQSNKKILFTKINGVTNDIGIIDLETFPLILFYPANSKDKFVKYEGKLTFEDFAVFINTHYSEPKIDL